MKITKWIKDHKKEIVVGIAAAGGVTTAYFLLKDGSVEKLKGHFGISFSFGNRDEMYIPYRDDIYTNLTLRNPGFTVADLGKVGEELKNRIDSLKDDTPIGNLSANHTITRR